MSRRVKPFVALHGGIMIWRWSGADRCRCCRCRSSLHRHIISRSPQEDKCALLKELGTEKTKSMRPLGRGWDNFFLHVDGDLKMEDTGYPNTEFSCENDESNFGNLGFQFLRWNLNYVQLPWYVWCSKNGRIIPRLHGGQRPKETQRWRWRGHVVAADQVPHRFVLEESRMFSQSKCGFNFKKTKIAIKNRNITHKHSGFGMTCACPKLGNDPHHNHPYNAIWYAILWYAIDR